MKIITLTLFLFFALLSLAEAALSIKEDPAGYGEGLLDAESGLLYLSARYLKNNIGIGIFLSRDKYSDLKKELFDNTYNYADADPINKFDPTGYSGMETLMNLGVKATETAVKISDTAMAQVLATVERPSLSASAQGAEEAMPALEPVSSKIEKIEDDGKELSNTRNGSIITKGLPGLPQAKGEKLKDIAKAIINNNGRAFSMLWEQLSQLAGDDKIGISLTESQWKQLSETGNYVSNKGVLNNALMLYYIREENDGFYIGGGAVKGFRNGDFNFIKESIRRIKAPQMCREIFRIAP